MQCVMMSPLGRGNQLSIYLIYPQLSCPVEETIYWECHRVVEVLIQISRMFWADAQN